MGWLFAGAVSLPLLASCGARTGLLPGERATKPDATGGMPAVEPEPDPTCVDLTLDYTTEPASVLLLIDRSGSMTEPFGFGTRWSVVRDALFDEERGLVTTLDGVANTGLAFYTSRDGFSGGTCPMLDASSLEFSNGKALRDAFDATFPEPEGDTPTGEAVSKATELLLAAAAPGPRYLVLVTDGEPDTCAVPDPQEGQPESLSAVAAAQQAGIPVFTVGVSTDIAGDHLQRLANAGAGRRLDAVWGRDDDAARPIQASDDPSELANQLVGTLADLRLCTLQLGYERAELDITQARVLLDGQRLSESNDFVFEGEKLTLLGPACAAVQGDANRLEVELPCAP